MYVLSLNYIDDKANDFCTKIITNVFNKKSSDNVVIVAIDSKSTDKIKWAWQRDLEYYAGAKAIIFHNLVLYPDSYYPQKDLIFYNHIAKNKRLINSYILVNSAFAGDVLPGEFLKEFDKKNNVNITDKRHNSIIIPYKAVINLPKDYLLNVNNLASSILSEDKDEILRNYMPIVFLNDKIYPSIALSAYSMYTGIKDFVLYDDYLCSSDNCKTLKIPIKTLQTRDSLGNTIEGLYTKIDWYKPQSDYYMHKTYSAIDVLVSYYDVKRGSVPKIPFEAFKDKIVIIGLNADKSVWEQLSETPVMYKQADIDVHASFISNMLANSFQKNSQFDATLIITVIFSMFVILGFRRFKYNMILATSLSVLYFSYYLVQYKLKIIIPPVTPIITIYLSALMKQLYSLITIDKTVDMIKRAMGKYVSKDVMKSVLSNLDKLKVGGSRAVVTILFVDIRNFTGISENLSPQDVTIVLNEYFSTIEPIIAKYHGIINKYMGDGVLAIFGEPIKQENHAINAVKCAMDIMEAVKLLRSKFIMEDKPKIEIGIGINTGEVFAGNIGTDERLEYTVIGDNVNLAYRIESYNRLLKTSFLISQYTYDYVKDYVDCVKLSQVDIKGKSKPIDIYEVLNIK